MRKLGELFATLKNKKAATYATRSKGSQANGVTVEGSFAVMCPQMNLQIGKLAKGLPTDVALVVNFAIPLF